MQIAVLTDVEGRWEKLEDFTTGNPLVTLSGDRLDVSPGALFVFGGDAVDRGPHGRRLLRTLLDVRQRQPDQVVLLAGNRDINKLRLRRELADHPPAGAPSPLPERLRYILARTMGAPDAFAHRQAEIGGDEGDVVQSFLDDVAPDGLMTAWLRHAVLAFRHEGTLFVHGGLSPESYGNVPNGPRVERLDPWIAALNTFLCAQLDAFVGNPAGAAALVAYQAPIRGTRQNDGSVVYGRTAGPDGNPRLPLRTLRQALRREGVDALVVGHTPSGDTPSVLTDAEGFLLIMADNAYSPLERGSRVTIGPAHLETFGRALAEGKTVEVIGRWRREEAAWVPAEGEPPALGRCDVETGELLKGRTPDGRLLLFRFAPGFHPEQHLVSDPSMRRWGIREEGGDLSRCRAGRNDS